MKLQILFIFTVIYLLHECQCQLNIKKQRLERAYKRIVDYSKTRIDDGLHDEIRASLDLDCVKKFLNLPQNNRMMMKAVEYEIYIAAAELKCSDKEKSIHYYFDNMIHDYLKERLTCFKWRLKNFEPDSKLVENVEISDEELVNCEGKYSFKMYNELEELFESRIEPLKDYTCGAVTSADDYIKFSAKGAIVKYGDVSEDLKKEEMEKLRNYIYNTALTIVECNLRRFEDNPAALLVNDTLNFYYNNPTKPDDGDSTKLEEAIDHNCVKEKLNLPENGQKSLLEVEAKLLIASAKSQCIKVDSVEFASLFIDFALSTRRFTQRSYSCAKYKIKELDPTSKFAVTTDIDEHYEKSCSFYGANLNPYEVPFWDYRNYIGPIHETTCGVMTEDIFDLMTYKTMLVGNLKDKELKINETHDLFEFVTDKLHKLADCIYERIK